MGQWPGTGGEGGGGEGGGGGGGGDDGDEGGGGDGGDDGGGGDGDGGLGRLAAARAAVVDRGPFRVWTFLCQTRCVLLSSQVTSIHKQQSTITYKKPCRVGDRKHY